MNNDNSLKSEFENKLLFEIFTHFVWELEGNLNIKNKNVNNLIKELKNENDNLSDEIDNFFN